MTSSHYVINPSTTKIKASMLVETDTQISHKLKWHAIERNRSKQILISDGSSTKKVFPDLISLVYAVKNQMKTIMNLEHVTNNLLGNTRSGNRLQIK